MKEMIKIKFLNKIFGEKETIRRSLIISFAISIIIVILCSLLAFYLFVNMSAVTKLVKINISSRADVVELLGIIKRSVIIIVLNVIGISIILMGIMNKKIVRPIKEITDATKKVAKGNFDVELETTRQDEIGKLTNNFNKMVKDLRNTNELQNDFIDNVSHELKTPINSIEGFAKLLQEKDISLEERKEYTNIIIEESNRMLSLSNNMLKLSKLQNQDKIENVSEVNIAEQIRKEVAILEPRWKKKNIYVDVDLDDIKFNGDENLFLQVWTNLLDNAIKFTKNYGKIFISVKKEDDKIVVKIQDSGIGMTEEEKERIFEKFYQTDVSHSEEGSGLGLSIVKRIIDLSGGEIEVDSKKGEGTTFNIYLPNNIK